jgi:serine/threonine protein kinase
MHACISKHQQCPDTFDATVTVCMRIHVQAVQIRTDDPMQYYTNMKKLGQGASGTVFSGTDTRNGEKCALKFCPIAEVSTNVNSYTNNYQN